MSQIRAIIFDMDGVLVDTESIYMAIECKMFEERGIAMSKREHFGYIGMSLQGMWADLRARHHLAESPEALGEVESHAQIEKLENSSGIDPIPGVRELLAELETIGFALALASSSSRSVIDTILARSGLASFFTVSVAGEEVRRGKPAPDIFLAAARQLDVPPMACAVIEDSPHGIKAALAAGMLAIGFRNPSVPGLDLSHARHILPDYTAENRLNLLARLNAGQ